MQFHHRYDLPGSGFYRGLLWMHISDPEYRYFLTCKAKYEPKWYWRCPTNFAYRTLSIERFRYGKDSLEKVDSIVDLNDWSYTSADGSGSLGTNILHQWLAEHSDTPPTDEQVNYLLKIFQDAASGRLPEPRHHGIRPDGPLKISMQHFCLGFGVGWTDYLWAALWGVLVVRFYPRKI